MAADTSIYENLTERLVIGAFSAGERLRSDRLGEEFGVSASRIREVLLRLSADGLVDFLEQRGFRVKDRSEKLSNELTHLRIVLECEGAALSIRNGSVAWEARLTAAHHELKHIEGRLTENKEVDLLPLWSRIELNFHRTLIEGCGSEALIATHHNIYQRFRQQLISNDKTFKFLAANVTEHQGILDAVLERDTGKVQQLIKRHLSKNITDTALAFEQA